MKTIYNGAGKFTDRWVQTGSGIIREQGKRMMLDWICEGYEESSVKKNRRKDILQKLTSYLVEVGIKNFTFTKAYVYLGMEKKSLYRYYPNVHIIIVECAMILQNDFAENVQQITESMMEKARREERPALDCFKDVLSSIMAYSLDEKKASLFRMINAFESYLVSLEDQQAVERYQELKSRLRARYNVNTLLEMAVERGEIRLTKEEALQYSQVCYQSVIAYAYRYSIKKYDSSFYREEHLFQHLEMLIGYIKNL